MIGAMIGAAIVVVGVAFTKTREWIVITELERRRGTILLYRLAADCLVDGSIAKAHYFYDDISWVSTRFPKLFLWWLRVYLPLVRNFQTSIQTIEPKRMREFGILVYTVRFGIPPGRRALVCKWPLEPRRKHVLYTP